MATARTALIKTSHCHQPWQIALGVAFGLVCGLLPKSSLLFYGLAFLGLWLPLHLVSAVVVCAAWSCLAPSHALLAEQIGWWSLTRSPLQYFWAWLHELPLIPWLGLNHASVNGSLWIGGALSPPTFLATLTLCRRILGDSSPSPRTYLSKSTVNCDYKPIQRGLVAMENHSLPVGLPPTQANERPAQEPARSAFGFADPLDSAKMPEPAIRAIDESDAIRLLALEELLNECQNATSPGVDEVINRASQIAEQVDALIDLAEREDSVSEQGLFERTDSHVSFIPPTGTLASPEQRSHTGCSLKAIPGAQPNTSSGPRTNCPFSRRDDGSVCGLHPLANSVDSEDRDPSRDDHEQALRHLLHHLRAIRNRV